MYIELQITIITIKSAHLHIDNRGVYSVLSCVSDIQRMYVYFYCNCNYCNALHFAMSGLHFVKNQKFLR